MRWMLVVALASCSPSGRDPSAPPPDSHAASMPDAGPTVCYTPSVVGTVMAGTPDIQECAIWNSLESMSGNVTLTRTGSNLTMAFGSGVTFAGTVSDGGIVSLTYVQLHDYTDGCKWRATETLVGDLNQSSCVMMLSYNYVESIAVNNGECDTPCTGTSNFSLQIDPVIE